MKHPKWKTRLTCAAAAVAAMSPAIAQTSVTVYGVADAAVSFDKAGGSSGSATRISSGVMRASRLGFSGSEDLGGGLKAVFNLELGLDVDTGGFKSYAGAPQTAAPAAPGGTVLGSGFNRRSYLGLAGSFGTIALGRDYTPWFWSGFATDPFGFGLYGNLQAVAPLTGTGSERYARASNAIFYTTPMWGGFVGRAMYSAGSESTGGAGLPPRNANAMVGLGADYKYGPFYVSGAYQELKVPLVANGVYTGTDRRKDWIVGAKYTSGQFSVAGGYMKIVQPVANNDGTAWWFGGWVPVGPGRLGAMGQRLKLQSTAGDRTATVYGVAYVHALSKRTEAYLSVGQARNNALGTFAVVASDVSVAAGAPGASPRAVGIGLAHTF